MSGNVTQSLQSTLPASAQLEIVRHRLTRLAQSTNRESQDKERHRLDPSAYAADVLRVSWWAKQAAIAESVRDNRRTVVYSGHGVGKTHLIAGVAQWHFDCFDPSITLTTAPNWQSIHDLVWGEIKAQRPVSAGGRMMDLRIDGGPMHYARGHNAESSAGFQGRHEARVLIVIDEAQGVPQYIWEATNAMMTSPHCRVLAVGNPTETSGAFYESREDPAWNAISMSCLDHPNIAAELAGLAPPYPKAVSLVWVEEMIAKHATPATTVTADCFEFPPGSGQWYVPDDDFRTRVLGLFPRQSSRAIWSEAWLEAARKGVAGPAWGDNDLPELGVDVARYGWNETVLYARRGAAVLEREAYQKSDTMETTGHVVGMAGRVAAQCGADPQKIRIKVDDGGVGGGVTDRLRELNYAVVPVNAGEKALDADAYQNRRAELWFVTAERARDLRLDLSRLPEHVYKKLAAELRAARYKVRSAGERQVESKDEMKDRTGRSPDDADAFNLSFAAGTVLAPGVMAGVAKATPGRFGRGDATTGSRWRR